MHDRGCAAALAVLDTLGAAIGLCGCYFGYRASGGAEGVGKATTQAVVSTMAALILLEYLLTNWLLYFFDARV